MKNKTNLFYLSACFLLASCGGSNTNNHVVAPTNSAPQVTSQTDNVTVLEGQNFTLSVTASDAEGDNLTFNWTQVSGSTISIQDPTSATQNLTAAIIATDEMPSFEVEISDGVNTTRITISVSIKDITPTTLVNSNGDALIVNSLVPGLGDSFTVFHGGGQGRPSTTVFQSTNSANSMLGTVEELAEFNLLVGAADGGIELLEGIAIGTEPQLIMQQGIARQFNGTPYTSVSICRANNLVDGSFVSMSSFPCFPSSPNSISDIQAPDFDFLSSDSLFIGTDQIVTVIASNENIVSPAFQPPPGSGIAPFPDLAGRDHNVEAFITNVNSVVSNLIIAAESPSIKTDISVAPLDNSTYMVGWAEETSASDFDLFLQQANATGLIGSRITANDNTPGNQDQLRTITTSDGRVFLAWRDASGTLGDSDGTSVKGRILQANGNFVTNEFLINNSTPGDQSEPFLLALQNNQVLIAWIENVDQTQQIRAQVYDTEGNRTLNELLIATGLSAENASSISGVQMENGTVILSWTAQSGSQIVALDPIGN